jgi:uncharacterized protein
VKKEQIEAIRSEARKFFGDVDPSHDWLHVKRVEKLAEEIADKEGSDREIVKIAVLLHDIGREKEDDGEIDEHAEWGAEKAGEILQEHEMEEDKISRIQHCIRSHRYSTGPEPETVEAKVLSDADNLDALGATGVARTFSVAGERKNPLADPDRPIEEDGTEAGETALNHFYKKVLTLKDRMYTDAGREIAEERLEFTKKFVERLEKEIRGEK